MRRRRDPQREIGEYVRTRLREECGKARGVAASIARATGFTTAHLAQVQRPGVGIGEGFARAMATYWGFTYAQLEEAALEWARRHPAAADPQSPARSYVLRPLSQLPGWGAALEEARRRYRSIPEAIWEETAAAVLPSATEATAERVGRVAQILFDTSPGQPGYGTDATAAARRELEQNPPQSNRLLLPMPKRPKRKAENG